MTDRPPAAPARSSLCLQQPLLLPDTDPARAIERQQEMMAACFGGIGPETKAEKRMALAMQQLDLEQRHALRLLLIYPEAAGLVTHLKRCLAEPAYGYGQRGDQGRTIAQALAAAGELAATATAWWERHRAFQQQVLTGMPVNFRSLFDQSDLDSFVPLLQRLDEQRWRLGLAGEGRHRDFQGPLRRVWPRLCDTYLNWVQADNQAWLSALKQQAAQLPDSILRMARAERLRRRQPAVSVRGCRVLLEPGPAGPGWPRTIYLVDRFGEGQVGLSRLSGHGLYELAWNGGANERQFELSGSTRAGLSFEHTDLAARLAEALGAELGLQPEPVTAPQVEATYLRRLKAGGAELGPPGLAETPPAIEGRPVASYIVGPVSATLLRGERDFAYVTAADSQTAVLLRHDRRRGALVALPVIRGRPRRDRPLMSTNLAEINVNVPDWNRALCAWGAWLVTAWRE